MSAGGGPLTVVVVVVDTLGDVLPLLEVGPHTQAVTHPPTRLLESSVRA